jgi:hypothetical protein
LYAKEASSIGFDYEGCPSVCPDDETAKLNAFCDGCPVLQAENNFKDFSIDILETSPDTRGKWQKWGFDSLKQTVEEISGLEDLPIADRTIKTHRLIQCFQGARRRAERIERENSEPAE